jgi:hypothetical protein
MGAHFELVWFLCQLCCQNKLVTTIRYKMVIKTKIACHQSHRLVFEICLSLQDGWAIHFKFVGFLLQDV